LGVLSCQPRAVCPGLAFGSILKFTETVFGLPVIGTTDRRADDLSDCFDFSQTPRARTSRLRHR
jgi:hypothetical protein